MPLERWSGTSVFQIRDQLYAGFELLASDVQPYVERVNRDEAPDRMKHRVRHGKSKENRSVNTEKESKT